MCVDFTTEIQRTKTKRIAYKIVRCTEVLPRMFLSQWAPYNRLIQTGCKGKGKNIHYRIGESVESNMDTTPGIFMYSMERPYFRGGTVKTVLKMEIPEGTRYREGEEATTRKSIICAEKVIPIEELK